MRIATLGPEGTDAHNEALKLTRTPELMSSFEEALRKASDGSHYALVAAGYARCEGETIVETWADLHFRFSRSLELVRCWPSPTKEMCVALGPGVEKELGDVESVALHPATREFLPEDLADAHRVYVNSKPHAVELARRGVAEACIGSVDVARRDRRVAIRRTWTPSMVWCLYAATGSRAQTVSASVVGR